MISPSDNQSLDALLEGIEPSLGQRERILGEEQVLDFLSQLHEQMESGGVSQAELGRRFGVQRSQVRRWIAGDNALKAQTMFALARCLGQRLEVRWVPDAAAARTGAFTAPVASFAEAAEVVAPAMPNVVEAAIRFRNREAA
jgi:transcriptional regulator with XRE-family HTH domain